MEECLFSVNNAFEASESAIKPIYNLAGKGDRILALVVLGAADVISVVIRSPLVQIETPDEMRGRVSAVNSMFIGTSNQLGEFESGASAALFGTVPAVLIGGIGTIIVVLLWMRLFPKPAQIDALQR